jgi:hypothetical protein
MSHSFFEFFQETLVVASGASASASFSMLPGCWNVGVHVPDLSAAGAVYLQMTDAYSGTTPISFHTVTDDNNSGAKAILVASGSDPAWVNFSRLIGFTPGVGIALRFKMAVQAKGSSVQVYGARAG